MRFKFDPPARLITRDSSSESFKRSRLRQCRKILRKLFFEAFIKILKRDLGDRWKIIDEAFVYVPDDDESEAFE